MHPSVRYVRSLVESSSSFEFELRSSLGPLLCVGWRRQLSNEGMPHYTASPKLQVGSTGLERSKISGLVGIFTSVYNVDHTIVHYIM